MLSFKFTDINGEELSADNPFYVLINRDENIPADDLTVMLPIMDLSRELSGVTVFDGEENVFKGVVDEQVNFTDTKDCYTKIVARSMAAVLLDNECKPISYSYPSTSVIFKRHLLLNGIERFKGGERVVEGNIKIPKGAAEWQALTSFSLKAFGKTPRVEADGTVNFNGVESDKSLIFSNTDGIGYYSVKENNKRCKPISEVCAKTSASGFYDTVLHNDAAEKRGIRRIRYIDALSDSTLQVGDAMIKNCEKSSYEITVRTPERLPDVLGAKAVISDMKTLKNNLYVSAVNYRLTPEKEETILTLKGA